MVLSLLGRAGVGAFGAGPFVLDHLGEPAHLALGGLQAVLVQLAGVAVQPLARPGKRAAHALALLLDAAAASAGEGMVVRLADVQGLGAIAQELGQPGKGLVSLVVPGEDGAEVEIALPKRVQVTPALRNRVATLPGVLAVEAV